MAKKVVVPAHLRDFTKAMKLFNSLPDHQKGFFVSLVPEWTLFEHPKLQQFLDEMDSIHRDSEKRSRDHWFGMVKKLIGKIPRKPHSPAVTKRREIIARLRDTEKPQPSFAQIGKRSEVRALWKDGTKSMPRQRVQQDYEDFKAGQLSALR